MRRIDLRGAGDLTAPERDLGALLPRAVLDVGAATAAVRPVVEAIRERGAAAVREAGARFDGVAVDTLRVPADELARALAELDPAVRAALEEAADRARAVHTAQLRPDEVVRVRDGLTVTERWVPVRRVGLYVPGGRVAYPSSVVMNVVPALVAGVESLAVASPPQAEFGGLPHPSVLAACALLGVTEVYRVGGAQAVAMFAYGTARPGTDPADACPRVDVVTGPGNIYVAAAKRLVAGTVGIDSEAGPTEIGILADSTADPAAVAADLVAQAEHDPLAACILVTPDEALCDAVDVELERQIPTARHRERVVEALGAQSGHVLVADLEAGIAVMDEWAPEHLEVITEDAASVARRIRNAGAIFVGPWAPVSLGDYLAGSNHVLPTGGTARHTGGLGVGSFLRGIHLVECSREALAVAEPHVTALGGAEDLTSHVAAVQVRVGGR